MTTTFALALVPLLAGAIAKNEQQAARGYRDLALRITLLLGGAASLGLIIIIEPTNSMLFTDRNGSDVLTVIAMAIGVSSLYLTTAAILQGYGQAHLPAIAVMIGLVVKLASNIWLIPKYGTLGAAWATVLALATMVLFLFIVLKKN